MCNRVFRCASLITLLLLAASPLTGARDDARECASTSQNRCGIQALSDRIVGGEVTSIDEFPWMALLSYTDDDGEETWGCGGSFIGTRTILTASHCLLPTLTFVRLGEHNVSSPVDCQEYTDQHDKDCADPPMDFHDFVVLKHPRWSPVAKQNDVGLIKLMQTPPVTDFIHPICLPCSDIATVNASVAGWGANDGIDTRATSESKLKAVLKIVDHGKCQLFYRQSNIRIENQICAGGVKGVNACRGDSGGPLMIARNNIWFVIGIVSFGPQICAYEHGVTAPSVYTKVFEYGDWIRSNMV
ncbi:CLIP domain-containing serine protease B4-like [Phlebotomus argentipes]|uniref:CLIP domain-containing serine protease B4-like n=1 Tax=Phlebotomus argentipes TaxID=94469 RepID=UPI002893023E|nr:CLIP domain-containing serine protease B4-like [Phlebotomus argentipes]